MRKSNKSLVIFSLASAWMIAGNFAYSGENTNTLIAYETASEGAEVSQPLPAVPSLDQAIKDVSDVVDQTNEAQAEAEKAKAEAEVLVSKADVAKARAEAMYEEYLKKADVMHQAEAAEKLTGGESVAVPPSAQPADQGVVAGPETGAPIEINEAAEREPLVINPDEGATANQAAALVTTDGNASGSEEEGKTTRVWVRGVSPGKRRIESLEKEKTLRTELDKKEKKLADTLGSEKVEQIKTMKPDEARKMIPPELLGPVEDKSKELVEVMRNNAGVPQHGKLMIGTPTQRSTK